MNKIRIVIVGAGSAQFSGGIIRDLCVTPSLYGAKLILMDVDEVRLDMIYRMSTKLAKELGADFTIEKTTDCKAAISGADFIINTAQDQGHPWQDAQIALANKHGFGICCDVLWWLSQMAYLLDFAHDMERYCPDALLLLSANPVFEGGTLITRETKVSTLGLCHGHYGYREIADVLCLERKYVTAKMFGFNHWIWMTDFRYKGADAYPLLDRWIEEKSEGYWKLPRKYSDQQMSRAAIHQYQTFGVMPIGDTPRMLDNPSMLGWIYNDSIEAKINWFSQQGGFDSIEGRKMYDDDLNLKLENIREAARNDKIKASELFPPFQSDEQIIPIIESLLFDKRRIYQVNIPNKGHLVEGFPEDIVVECEATVSGAGIQGIYAGRLPSLVMAGAMNPRYTQCEILNEAIHTGNREAFRLIFILDHYAKSISRVDALLDEWFADPRNSAIRKILK